MRPDIYRLSTSWYGWDMAEGDRESTDSSGFWSERKTAAVLKHGVLRRYLPVFATKTGTYARDGRVVYFDGYAGQGRYDDDSEGSPVIAARLAEQLSQMGSPRRLDLFLVEREAAEHRRLVEGDGRGDLAPSPSTSDPAR